MTTRFIASLRSLKRTWMSFKSISASFSNFDLATAWQNTGSVPLHPGAERFYREHGYMT